MKYNNLRKCMNLAEEMCKASGFDIEDADIDIVNYYYNEYGRIYQQRMMVNLDFNGAEVNIAITPKGTKNEVRQM